MGRLLLSLQPHAVQMIGLRQSIRETDFGKLADECLLRDATRGDIPNIDAVLTEREFLLDMLLRCESLAEYLATTCACPQEVSERADLCSPLYGADNLVDSAAVEAITRQFKHLTRRGKFKDEDSRRLTTRLVYEELRSRANRGMELSIGATEADLRDGAFRWKSYEDWKATSWQSRVYVSYETKAKELAERSKGTIVSLHLQNIVGALFSVRKAPMKANEADADGLGA